MPAPLWEDLSAFLQLDEFAVQATVTPQGGVSREVVGILDDPYLQARVGEYVAEDTAPQLTCAQVDVVGLSRNDTVVIDGTSYYLTDGPQVDGTGMAVLKMLKE